MYSSFVIAALVAANGLVAGHGVIVAATGDAGGSGSAIGGPYPFAKPKP